jgi:hypothetical protein
MASYMRIIRVQPPEGMADRIGQQWTAFWPERLRQLPGFQHAHFGVDRATGAVTGVQVFNERPDDGTFRQLSEEFRASLGEAAPPQAPQFTVYEILAEA